MFDLSLNLNEKDFSEMRSDSVYDVIVIGAGPSAISAAIYSIRKGLKVGIIADAVGGQVSTTNAVSYTHLTLPTTPYV